MFKKDHRALMRVAAATAAVVGTAVVASPAMADCTTSVAGAGCGTLVTGTALGQLSLAVATPAAMTLEPGVTPSPSTLVNGSTSLVTALDTSSSTPSISVKDAAATNPGFMQLVPSTGCSSSTTESKLNHPLNLASITAVVGWTDAAQLPADLSGTAVTLANSTLPVPSGSFTVNFKQPVDAGEGLLNPCLYELTATYTLQ